MGRHSTSQKTSGAAMYVGRVGALALALGIGAAVAGGAGVAHADDTTDNGTSGADPAQSSSNPVVGAGAPASSSTGADASGPTSPGVPTMQGLGGGAPTDPVPTAGTEPDSLPGLIARIPNQLAAVFGNGRVPGSNSATHVDPSSQGSPQTSKRTNGRSALEARPTIADGPDASPAHAVAPLSEAPDTTRQQRVTAAPFITAATFPATRVAAAQAAPTQATPRFVNPIAAVVSSVLSVLGFAPSASAGGSPPAPAPLPILFGALQLIRREIEQLFVHHIPSTAMFVAAENYANAHPAVASGAPNPGDAAPTAYGDVGKWMLEPDGQISDYGGQPYGGKALLESVNVVIVDPTSKTPAEAAWRLNTAMFWAGFPAQPIHSTGFRGTIDDITYGQQPTGLWQGFSDSLFVLPNDHGRIFGPDPVETSTGYVWSGAFSTEQLAVYDFLPAHSYVSSDMARAALATALIRSGQATFVGMVPLDNAYNTATTTTGDHDGYAVLLQLN